MRRIIKIGKKMMFVVAVAILAGLCLCLVLQLKPVIVMSGSMEPTIGTGSFLLVNENDKEIEEGDIIAFQKEKMLIAHRVVKVTDRGYITKGDANDSIDAGEITNASIKGTAYFWIPKVGYAVKWLASITGIICIITICAALILISILIGREEWDEEHENNEQP